ncbi:MAG: peroxiredoxin family protein [Gemmataceae bacterium]|nr:peroxiredoxin family protein [Gemmataceae bacterium]
MQKETKALTEAGVVVVGISYDAVDVLEKFATQQKIEFPLLSDPDHKVIEAYGLTNKEAKGKIEGVPYPGTMILDKEGVIRAKLFFDGYKDRHTPTDIIKAAKDVK